MALVRVTGMGAHGSHVRGKVIGTRLRNHDLVAGVVADAIVVLIIQNLQIRHGSICCSVFMIGTFGAVVGTMLPWQKQARQKN
jgi:hypothetical protein